MKHIVPFLGALLLAASTSLLAQAPQDGKGQKHDRKARHERMDCSKAENPQRCEERRAKMKEKIGKARQACEGKQGTEHRECMLKQGCASAKNPAGCEAEHKQRMEKRKANREKIREACKGKQGDERKACIREHRKK